jgi:hypothetical protein
MARCGRAIPELSGGSPVSHAAVQILMRHRTHRLREDKRLEMNERLDALVEQVKTDSGSPRRLWKYMPKATNRPLDPSAFRRDVPGSERAALRLVQHRSGTTRERVEETHAAGGL